VAWVKVRSGSGSRGVGVKIGKQRPTGKIVCAGVAVYTLSTVIEVVDLAMRQQNMSSPPSGAFIEPDTKGLLYQCFQGYPHGYSERVETTKVGGTADGTLYVFSTTTVDFYVEVK